MSADDYSKLFLLNTYIILYKFDIVCLSETYLDSTTSTDDDKLQIPEYTLIHCDHPSNPKRGRVCVQSSLSIEDSCSSQKKCQL